jgi:predicted dehydrogenase
MAEKFRNKPSIYTSVDEMLNSEKLDACVITSPDYCHAPNAVKVLEKGINVLIDKPLATTVEGCDNILEAAEKSGKTVMIGFNLRHDPTLKRLKQIIKDGILGKVFMIENREFYDGGRTYMSRWNRKYKYSGGLWIHKGSHDFDVFNWLLDFPKPVKVSSTAGINVFNEKNIPFELKKGIPVGPTCTECPYKSTCPDRYEIEEFEEWGNEAREEDNYSKDLCMYTSDKDTHDNGIAIVEYADGSRASHLECFVSSFSDRRYTVVGDRGIAEVSLHGRKIKVKARWTGEEIIYNIPEVQGGHGGADPGLVENFVNVISKGLSNTSTAEHGRTSTAIGQAAELSRRENRTVQLKELI